MKSNTYAMLALAAAAKMANAHTTVWAAWVNDVDQGTGNSASGYIRSPPSNDPVKDVTSTDMTCNVNGDTAAAKTISVAAGDKLTFEWHHDSRSDSDDIIASSHKGPILVYMAPTEKGSAGSGWVKISEDGYSDGTWAVDTLIANSGKHSVTVPDVPAGKYLFRPEIIALHEGSTEGGAQLYMECVQVEVTSDGANTLPDGVSIPGAYTATDDGILFNIYGSFDTYPIPGPTVWSGASSSASSTAAAKVAVSSSAAATSVAATSSAAAAVETPAAVETSAAAPAATTPATSAAAAPVQSEQATAAVASPAASATPAAGSNSNGSVKVYNQCGGTNYSGATSCESGSTCKEWNQYYSQCVPSA